MLHNTAALTKGCSETIVSKATAVAFRRSEEILDLARYPHKGLCAGSSCHHWQTDTEATMGKTVAPSSSKSNGGAANGSTDFITLPNGKQVRNL